MPNDDVKKHESGIKDSIKVYRELKKLQKSDEFETYFNLLLKTASAKMIQAFTSDNIKDWDDFCKIRGEIHAYLYPIQEVKDADAMLSHLQEQLAQLYGRS